MQNYAAGTYQPHGLAFNFGSTGGVGFTQIGFGLNAGLGYVYTDLIEFGGAVGLDIGHTSSDFGGGSAYQFLLEPLVKFNMGSRWHWADHLNPFGFAGVPLGFTGT